MLYSEDPLNYARLYQELRETAENQLIKEEREKEAVQREKTTALAALQNQLAAISKVCTLTSVMCYNTVHQHLNSNITTTKTV